MKHFKLAIAGLKQVGKTEVCNYLIKKLSADKFFVYYEGLYRPIYKHIAEFLKHKFGELEDPKEIEKYITADQFNSVIEVANKLDNNILVNQLEYRIQKTLDFYSDKNKEEAPFLILIDDLDDISYYHQLKNKNWVFLEVVKEQKRLLPVQREITFLSNDESKDKLYRKTETFIKNLKTKIRGNSKC